MPSMFRLGPKNQLVIYLTGNSLSPARKRCVIGSANYSDDRSNISLDSPDATYRQNRLTANSTLTVNKGQSCMEFMYLRLEKWIGRAKYQLHEIPACIRRIHSLVFEPGARGMLKKFFEATEVVMRAATYSLILLMGLSIVSLGAFTILFLSIRIGQFLWVLVFKEKWL